MFEIYGIFKYNLGIIHIFIPTYVSENNSAIALTSFMHAVRDVFGIKWLQHFFLLSV